MPPPDEAETVVPLHEPEKPLQSPSAPLPSAPPEPPPSLVAMRRLMFDTDDAKLKKHDHFVNNTRIIDSLKKDLSKDNDSRSQDNLLDKNKDFIDKALSQDSDQVLEAVSSANISEALAQNVNNSTISVCSNESVAQRMDDREQTSSPSEIVVDSVKLISNPKEDVPLDLSDTTPSCNDNCNTLNLENTTLYSDSNSNNLASNISIVLTEDSCSENLTDSVVDAINSELIATSEKKDIKHQIVESNIEKEVPKIISKDYPEELNPFDCDEDDDNDQTEKKKSTNPFGSDSEEEEDEVVEKSLKSPSNAYYASKNSSQIVRPASTNPFDTDEEEEEDEMRPVPLPRKSLQSSPEPTPMPRRSKLRSSGRSIASISSITSNTSTLRKKRPAPAPPTNGTLTPSSHYSSMSSLVSTSIRSRKKRPAPMPPSSINDVPVKQTNESEECELVPEMEVSPLSKKLEEPSLETKGELLYQIEEGMRKLIAEDNKISVEEDKMDLKEKFDFSAKPSTTTNSNKDLDKQNIAESVKIIENKKNHYQGHSYENIDIQSHSFEVENTDNQNPSFAGQETSSLQNVSITPAVEVCKEEIILGYTEKDKKIGGISKDEIYNASLVEAFNAELKSISRNSSGIKFDEIEPIKHSTPVKLLVSHGKDSSLEDVVSGNSYSGTFYPSPSESCADSSSYQESLSSPPSEKKQNDTTNMHHISENGVYCPPKSSYGTWKRKKPAPPVPLPQRRIVKPMAIHRIKQELGDIEIKQQELERQGVALEKKIRTKFDSDSSITPYLEELVLQLFELVNEKNELFRKQAELMYLRRQHQLEEEQAELEYQIRCLMARPEVNKTDSDKELEEKLIQRLIEVVERRDSIVQCLEMDRLREAEEDKSIHKQLDRFNQSSNNNEHMKTIKKHKKKKVKHSTLKSFDLDKDSDESGKEYKKKKKWYSLHHRMGKLL